MRAVLTALTLLALSNAALSDVTVSFVEGAPKDRFVIANKGGCPFGKLSIEINMAGSSAGLVFDVSSTGAGVEVFQPFELTSGGGSVAGQPIVRDGDQKLELQLSQFLPQEEIIFTIDVDDTVSKRQTTVSNSEIVGAEVTVRTGSVSATGTFGSDAVAVAEISACNS